MGNASSFGAFSDIFQSLFTWVAYNRDMYADNVAMRQNQLYQKRNYHLSWISIARDDVRDVMQTSVDKVNSYMVVTTLVFGIAGGMVVELDTSSCSHLHQVLIYMCLTVSMIYLIISIVYAVMSSNAAFSYSVDILINAIRPDPTDAYDKSFDYMKQSQQFEKTLTQVLRIPILRPMYRNYLKAKRPRLEHFNVGKGLTFFTDEGDSNTKAADPPFGRDDSDFPSPKCARPGAGKQNEQNAQMQSNINLMFDQFNQCGWLWKDFERASMAGLSYGSLYLGYAAAYVSLGVLCEYGRSMSHILALMWIIALMIIFTATYPNKHKPEILNFYLWEQDRDIQFTNWFGPWNLYAMLAISYTAPALALLLDVFVQYEVLEKPDLRWMEVPVYVAHTLSAFLHLTREATTKIELGPSMERFRKKEPVEGQAGTRRGSTAGSSSSSMSGVAVSQSAVGRPSNGIDADKSLNQSARSLDRDYEAHLDDAFDPEGDPQSEKIDETEGKLMPEQIAMRTVERIERTFWFVKRSMVTLHLIIAFGWLCFFLESMSYTQTIAPSLSQSEDPKEANSPRRTSQVVQGQMSFISRCHRGEECDHHVGWPSEFFQPLAMACAKDDVFVADEFHVYQLNSGTFSPVACILSEAIVDISAACNATSCWPLVLTGNDHTKLVNCQTGEAFSFSQTAYAERIASRNGSLAGSFYAVRRQQLVEYRLAQQQHLLEPWWPVADVNTAGLRAVDVVDDRIFFFRNSVTEGVASVRLESDKLKRNSSSTRVWELPKRSPPMISGCVRAGSSALVLLQSEEGDYAPRLVTVELQ